MRIGYPCLNLTIGCRGARTFRLTSYSQERLIATVTNNLDCLGQMLRFNAEHGILFFRITSDLVPFASHPVCSFDWRRHFRDALRDIGRFIRVHDLRISMHPDQFVVINSPDGGVLERSVAELVYHAQLLDAMGLDTSAKIQIHVGGVYGDKANSSRRFVERSRQLPEEVARRLVVENDDRLYRLADVVRIASAVGLPALFDVFHHEVNSSGETIEEALSLVCPTWTEKDGVTMVDYSSARPRGKRGSHAESLDPRHFRRFLEQSRGHDLDVMLEIKNKEQSALKAVGLARRDARFVPRPVKARKPATPRASR